MANAFDWYPPDDWRQTAKDVKAILTEEEFESARASTPNAHFTSPMVIAAMCSASSQAQMCWSLRWGEGHFFGMMPFDGKRTGVELDSITARIAQKLYPDSTIFNKGFEQTDLPDNYFHAVIGNVPFGTASSTDCWRTFRL
jgi:hypothetical protein